MRTSTHRNTHTHTHTHTHTNTNTYTYTHTHIRTHLDYRANEEIKKRIKWEKEIAVKKHNLEQLKIKCRKLKQQHKKNEKYQFFLNKVLNMPFFHYHG